MKRHQRIRPALAASLLAAGISWAAATAPAQSNAAAAVKPTTRPPVLREWKGQHSGVTTATRKVVRTPAEWAALWRQVHASRVPTPAPPKVDFAKEMVIAAFLGQRPTGGHAISIQDVQYGSKEIRVTVREQAPPPDAFLTQALTQPYHLVVVRKSALPVRFVNSAQAATR